MARDPCLLASVTSLSVGSSFRRRLLASGAQARPVDHAVEHPALGALDVAERTLQLPDAGLVGEHDLVAAGEARLVLEHVEASRVVGVAALPSSDRHQSTSQPMATVVRPREMSRRHQMSAFGLTDGHCVMNARAKAITAMRNIQSAN